MVRRGWLSWFGLPGALVVALVVLTWWGPPDRGRLHIFFLDTPGDAALIQTPRGRYVLVDGGSDPSRLALHLGRRLPFWERKLEAVILTRADEARLPGQVAALARYRAGLALAPALWQRDDGEWESMAALFGVSSSEVVAGGVVAVAGVQRSYMEEWARLLAGQRTPVHVAQCGDRLNLGGALLTVLATGSDTAPGLVLQVDYGAARVVFAGASNEASEPLLLASAHPLTVLAYPWQRELDTPLLAAWQPRAIVFTTAQEREPPALLTYAERARSGAVLYHPDIDGTIELVSDGQQAWIETAAASSHSKQP